MYKSRIILYFIIVLIVIVLPSLKMMTKLFFIFTLFFFLLVLCFCVLFLCEIPLSIRISIILIVLAIFRVNFSLVSSLVGKFFNLAYITPVSSRKDDTILRKYVHDLYSEHFDLHTNFDQFPAPPSIIVSNYCKDRLENIACIILPGNLAIAMRDWIANLGLKRLVKWPLITKKTGNYETLKNQVMNNILQGRHIFSYITSETTLRPDLFIRMRTGMFKMAQELNVPITPIAFDYIDMQMGIIPYQRYEICVGDTFYVNDVGAAKQKVMHFFKSKMGEFMKNKYSVTKKR